MMCGNVFDRCEELEHSFFVCKVRGASTLECGLEGLRFAGPPRCYEHNGAGHITADEQLDDVLLRSLGAVDVCDGVAFLETFAQRCGRADQSIFDLVACVRCVGS